MNEAALEGLRECAQLVSRRLVPLGAQACGQRWGYVPVFVDGPGIEVEGQLCENAGRGYHSEKQYWLHSVFAGVAWVSARLNAGGTDVKGDWREQLDQDVVPWLTGRQPVWLRADSAYSCQDLVSYCRRKSWDYSVSVTDPRKKAPILRLAAAMGLREDEWEPLDAAGKERAIVVAYRPARWPEEQVCVVIRRDWDGEQRLLEPVCTVIPVSHDRLPVAAILSGLKRSLRPLIAPASIAWRLQSAWNRCPGPARQLPMARLRNLCLAALAVGLLLSLAPEGAFAQRRRVNRIKLGTVAPKNSVYHEALLKVRQKWREISSGSVDLTIYPGGVAGDEVTMLQKMRAGQLHAALISGTGMSRLEEGVSALQVPLMFDSFEEFDFVRSQLAPQLEERIQAKGYKVLGWGDAGWAYFFAVEQFRTPADVRGMKLYTSKGDDEMLRLYSEFGFRAVPLDLTELQANLETGLVEIFAVPPLVAAGYQWFGSAPNMLDLRFLPIVGALLIDDGMWQAIPADQRVAMQQAALAAVEEVEAAVREQELEAIEEMRQHGLTVIEADGALQAAWRREVEEFYPALRGRYAPADLMDEALRLRNSFRSR